MPGKARRVASRQAQLGRRRKRQQNTPENSQTAVPQTNLEGQADQQAPTELSAVPESPVVDAPETTTPPARPTPRPHRPPRPSPVAARSTDGESIPARGGARGRRERLVTQNNIGTEIRRILAMSATVLAVIIALGIVL